MIKSGKLSILINLFIAALASFVMYQLGGLGGAVLGAALGFGFSWVLSRLFIETLVPAALAASFVGAIIYVSFSVWGW